jgi:putative alpha-1,2-mannosidase
VHREQGDVKIHAPAADASHRYITRLMVNGRPQTKTWLPESFALRGGSLDFTLSQSPDKNWGTDDAPPSFEK